MFRIMDTPHFTDDCKLFIRFPRDSVKNMNSYESKISALDTERMRLEGELEASTSIKTLEESAEKNLGLSKIDSSQIEYVNLTGDDEI